MPTDLDARSDAPTVRMTANGLRVDGVRVDEPSLVAFVLEREPEERGPFIERALRIGLAAVADASASLDVDAVRREFEAMLRQAEGLNDRMARHVDTVLRENFADGEGRLPRTLERFLGDQGQLRAFVTELFDDGRRDSALGRVRTLLGTYFDGDASRLAQLLDPTRIGSPLHQFRVEVSDGFARLNERLTAIEAAAAARAAERGRSAAKGADFEDLVGLLLADLVRSAGDLVDRTTDESGDVMRSRKGDFLVTLDPRLTNGAEVRIVVECKDRAISSRALREELAEARRNRDAAIALVIFSATHAPTGVAPFDVRMGDVYCVIDAEAPEPANLEAGLRLARLLALASLRERLAEVDAVAVRDALDRIRAQLDLVRGLKTQLTAISTTSGEVAAGLDRLREGILALVAGAEAEIHLEARSAVA